MMPSEALEPSIFRMAFKFIVSAICLLGLIAGSNVCVVPVSAATIRHFHQQEPELLRDPAVDAHFYAFLLSLTAQREQLRLLQVMPLVSSPPKSQEAEVVPASIKPVNSL
jgi:hypothetical protein